MIDRARCETGDSVEPQPLWEYPCYALHAPVQVARLSVAETITGVGAEYGGDVTISTDVLRDSDATLPARWCKAPQQAGHLYLNGVAVWADWHYGSKSLSTGPLNTTHIVGKKVSKFDRVFHMTVMTSGLRCEKGLLT